MERIKNFQRVLLDNGLIFEINRKVLHPLGMALVVEVSFDNSKKINIVGVDKTEDEEGIIFDNETFDEGREKYEAFLKREGERRLRAREKSLGFTIQEGKYEQADENK